MSNRNIAMPTAPSNLEAQAYKKVTMRLVPFLVLSYLIAWLDRVNVGFAKLQMSADLGFSEAVYGLGAGLFFISYFLVEIPSNVLLHRLGARLWMARIMISWGIISAAMMFAKTPFTFYVLRLLLGIAEAGFYPGVILYLTYWYPSYRRGKILTIFALGAPLSGLIGAPISGWIMQNFNGVHNLAGWQWLFLLEGIPSIFIGCAAFFILTDRISHAKWLSTQEKDLLTQRIQEDSAHKLPFSFRAALTNGRVWFLTLIYFCLIMGFYTVGFWLPTIIQSTGIKDPLHIGLLTAIPYLAAMIALPLFGYSADKHRERRWHLVVACMMGGFGLITSVVWSHSPVITICGMTIAAMGVMSSLPLFWSLPTSFLGGIAAAAGIGLINSCGNLGGFVSPYVIGFIKDLTHSMNIGLCVMASMLFIAALLTLMVPAKLVNR
ncbi:MAG: D-galactonate transporter [Glomeribacter sp. 1016415]|nr:D-galactonate transporter [Glomeribacter sp. 1016415]